MPFFTDTAVCGITIWRRKRGLSDNCELNNLEVWCVVNRKEGVTEILIEGVHFFYGETLWSIVWKPIENVLTPWSVNLGLRLVQVLGYIREPLNESSCFIRYDMLLLLHLPFCIMPSCLRESTGEIAILRAK
jgi:hypothetical protein